MDTKSFLENFGTIAEAPGGIEQLRSIVLSFAVEGRLSSSIRGDDEISSLYESLRAQGEHLGLSKAKRQRVAETSNLEDWHRIPRHWKWCRLAEVAHDLGQGLPDSTFGYIDVGSVDGANGFLKLPLTAVEPDDAPSRARKKVKEGTVIYSTVRPYLRNVAIVEDVNPELTIASTAFAVLHPFEGVESRYLLAC
jgi:type I restriction enzyme S subunit